MSDQFALNKYRSKNKYVNSKKRSHQLDEECYQPKYKQFKQNNVYLNKYKSNVDIVTLLKIKLEDILIKNCTELKNTIIEDIQPYGSRVSGIYTDNSDIDFHISYTSKHEKKKVIRSFANSLRQSRGFINVVPIVQAKIPIIKCVHRDTGIDCDLSFNNICAVHNSHLLYHIMEMDHRIKPVLYKLKEWAKKTGLICTNGFSSYSFYWLGLFCMQVMGILPSIHDLQKSIPDLVVEDWNCAFPKKYKESIEYKQKNIDENDILNVFYAYYSNFDFETLVISPYTGCTLLKKDFENIEQLPEELWRYKQFYKENKEHPKLLFLGTSKFNMYTQDPFQHNCNITARVTPKIFEKFIKSCVELKAQ